MHCAETRLLTRSFGFTAFVIDVGQSPLRRGKRMVSALGRGTTALQLPPLEHSGRIPQQRSRDAHPHVHAALR
jgi:hypothetical protein